MLHIHYCLCQLTGVILTASLPCNFIPKNRYPEPGFLGNRPSYGIYIRNAAGVSVTNLQLGWGSRANETNAPPCCTPDARPAVVVEKATGVAFTALSAKRAGAGVGPGYDVGLRVGAEDTVVKDSPGIVVRKVQ